MRVWPFALIVVVALFVAGFYLAGGFAPDDDELASRSVPGDQAERALPGGEEGDGTSLTEAEQAALAAAPTREAFGRPVVTVACDVSDWVDDATGIYVTHDRIRAGNVLLPGAQPSLVRDGALVLPALADQPDAQVFVPDVGLLHLSWPPVAEGAAECTEVDVVAPPADVAGQVTGPDGSGLRDVTVFGCGGVARTGDDGAFSVQIAGGRPCELQVVWFEGDDVAWGPTAAAVAGAEVTIAWADEPVFRRVPPPTDEQP